jgi:cobalamin-dependent methionine synthase I
MIGERTNANGSKASRGAMIAEDWQKCLDIAEDRNRDGARNRCFLWHPSQGWS